MSSFCSLRAYRTAVRKRTLKTNTKQKSKNKDKDDFDLQSKADSDEYGDSETVIGKAPLKNKNIVYILWWIRKIQRSRQKVNKM